MRLLQDSHQEFGCGYLADEWKLIQAILWLSAAIIPEQLVLLRELHILLLLACHDVRNRWCVEAEGRLWSMKDARQRHCILAYQRRRGLLDTLGRKQAYRMINCAAHLYRTSSLSSCGQISLRCPSPLCQHPEVSQAPCHLPVLYLFPLQKFLKVC